MIPTYKIWPSMARPRPIGMAKIHSINIENDERDISSTGSLVQAVSYLLNEERQRMAQSGGGQEAVIDR